MKIIETKIDSLIPADYNPRELTKKQYQDLKDSLTEFGKPYSVKRNGEECNDFN